MNLAIDLGEWCLDNPWELVLAASGRGYELLSCVANGRINDFLFCILPLRLICRYQSCFAKLNQYLDLEFQFGT
jgi:hypothetical protein